LRIRTAAQGTGSALHGLSSREPRVPARSSCTRDDEAGLVIAMCILDRTFAGGMEEPMTDHTTDRAARRRDAIAPRGIDKWGRLRARLRDAEWRRYGYLLLAGKALGIVGVFGLMMLASSVIGSPVHAEDAPALPGNAIVNPINTVWTLVAAFLVFGMQAGFTMLEAGFCRSRETVNVLMECVVDTCLCGLLFYAWGFAFMFGSGTPLIGTQYFFLQDVPATYGSSGVSFLAFWLFQFAFADTCSTITSGAMIGRTGFV